MTTMPCEDAHRLLPAHGELDVANALALEAHLAGCAECSEALRAQRELSEVLRREAPYHRMPDTLRERLRASLPGSASAIGQAAPATPGAEPVRNTKPPAAAPVSAAHRRRHRAILQWAAPLAAALVLAVGIDGLLASQRATGAITDEVIAGHVRSLLGSHLDDVASTDQHTVKPWFAGKLDYSPPVHDLAAHGFPLAGGRLDYIGRRTVAALDYRRRKHIINLYVWPSSQGETRMPHSETRNGFNVAHWAEDGMNWWAVSDLNAEELRSFAELLHAAEPPAG